VRPTTEPIVASDDEIRAALDDAVVPPLLAALAHLRGDLSLLRDDLRIDPLLVATPQGGMTEEQLAAARELALQELIRYRDAGCPEPPTATDDDLLAMMEFATGTEMPPGYLGLLEEELSVTGDDLRAPQWTKRELAPDTTFQVAIIGAGMSGLLAAYRLQQVGIPFVVIDKNADVGGTWLENTYPGCRVDNPNHNYSYSFAQRHDWPFHYSTQDVLHDYFRDFADAHELRQRIRFNTTVESLEWSEECNRWTLHLRCANGTASEVEAHAVVCAVGQLNRPSMPDIDGIDSFAGPSFHSARWRGDVDLAGKRVAVIGTGASAAQFIPVVAEQAGELLVFQRTPAWFAPTPDYHDAVEPGLRWLYAHVPFYSEWNRFWIFWRMGDGVLPAVTAEPGWESNDRAISTVSEITRQLLTAYLEEQFAERPDLLPHVVPTYPVGAKRMLRDNGVWAGALTRPNVHLMTNGISKVTPRGVVDGDGTEHEVDVIVYGTGFTASSFLVPMEVTGRDGVDLHERWHGDARAYLGLNVPGFPNFFMLYGPNTNIVVNGSIVYFSECGVRYMIACLQELLSRGANAMEVRPEAHDEFNVQVDAENAKMAWAIADVHSWYKNANGHIAQNWPFTLLEYWQRTRQVDPADYVFH
jgi:4-hydroxyacetophenone monooxygenase